MKGLNFTARENEMTANDDADGRYKKSYNILPELETVELPPTHKRCEHVLQRVVQMLKFQRVSLLINASIYIHRSASVLLPFAIT